MSESVNSPSVIVTLNIVPALEERVVDWLLSRDDGGFTSRSAHGHSSRHDLLTAAEQVSGRQRRVQFQVQIEGTRYEAFVGELRDQFSGTDLHYWVVPVLAAGQLD